MIDEKELIEQIKSLRVTITGLRAEKSILNEYAQHFKDSVIRIIDEQPKVGEWIPCNERLPEEKKFYEEIMRSPLCLVTVLLDDELMIGIDRTVNGVWTLEETFDKPKIIAWQPLQEPFKGETE
jgi:hypothetical protein